MRVKQVQACRPKDDGPSLDRPMRRKPARNAFSRDRSNYPPSPIAVPLAWLYLHYRLSRRIIFNIESKAGDPQGSPTGLLGDYAALSPG